MLELITETNDATMSDIEAEWHINAAMHKASIVPIMAWHRSGDDDGLLFIGTTAIHFNEIWIENIFYSRAIACILKWCLQKSGHFIIASVYQKYQN